MLTVDVFKSSRHLRQGLDVGRHLIGVFSGAEMMDRTQVNFKNKIPETRIFFKKLIINGETHIFRAITNRICSYARISVSLCYQVNQWPPSLQSVIIDLLKMLIGFDSVE